MAFQEDIELIDRMIADGEAQYNKWRHPDPYIGKQLDIRMVLVSWKLHSNNFDIRECISRIMLIFLVICAWANAQRIEKGFWSYLDYFA